MKFSIHMTLMCLRTTFFIRAMVLLALSTMASIAESNNYEIILEEYNKGKCLNKEHKEFAEKILSSKLSRIKSLAFHFLWCIMSAIIIFIKSTYFLVYILSNIFFYYSCFLSKKI